MFKIENCISFNTSNRTRVVSDVFNEVLIANGTTRVQWTALYFIANNPRINQSRLSELMMIKSSTVVRLIDRMRKEDLVIKTPLDSDRRNTLLTCSEKGKDLFENILPKVEEFEELILKNIDEDKLQICMDVLVSMSKNAKILQE